MDCLSSEVSSLSVFDQYGASHAFSSLYTAVDVQQTLFIFIRHFFCGSCKEYVCALSQLSPSPIPLVIIGCGQPTLIERYAKDTNCPFPIYADPTRKLYDGLGMIRTLSLGEKKPDYIQSSFLGNILKSAVSQFSAGTAMFQGGDIHQVGGEYLINREGKILWSHLMSNTRDHAEIDELQRLLSSSPERPFS